MGISLLSFFMIIVMQDSFFLNQPNDFVTFITQRSFLLCSKNVQIIILSLRFLSLLCGISLMLQDKFWQFQVLVTIECLNREAHIQQSTIVEQTIKLNVQHKSDCISSNVQHLNSIIIRDYSLDILNSSSIKANLCDYRLVCVIHSQLYYTHTV